MNTLIALITTIVLVTPPRRPVARETFIIHARSDTATLAVPIHAPGLWLRPENAVAKVIQVGEAMACKLTPEARQGRIGEEPAVINTVTLDCDGARFTVTGLQFGGTE